MRPVIFTTLLATAALAAPVPSQEELMRRQSSISSLFPGGLPAVPDLLSLLTGGGLSNILGGGLPDLSSLLSGGGLSGLLSGGMSGGGMSGGGMSGGGLSGLMSGGGLSSLSGLLSGGGLSSILGNLGISLPFKQ